jgi:hypothetical protein
VGVEITGIIEDPDGGQSRLTAPGNTYEDAKVALKAMVPEGHKLIVIRTR